MKNKTKIVVALAFAAVIGVSAEGAVKYSQAKNFKVNLPENFTLTAHTGCEGTEDNSLEAIKVGYEKGADIVEFDLNFDASGMPVLSHDEAENNSVALEEAFKFIGEYDSLKVNVDCKKTDNLKAVVTLSEKYGVRDRIFYTGIEEKDIPAVKEQTPDVEYYLNVPEKEIGQDEKSLSALADKVKSLGAVGINMKYTRCSAKLVEIFHSKGLLVSVWTVNSKSAMRRILPLGVDNITTRHPSDILELIKSKTEK